MARLAVNGGNQLFGDISISGKNAAALAGNWVVQAGLA